MGGPGGSGRGTRGPRPHTRYRCTVLFRVNSQCRNHTGDHTPHVHTVNTRCTVCAPPVTRVRDTVGCGGPCTYCGRGGVSPGSCGIVMRHSVAPAPTRRQAQATAGQQANRAAGVSVMGVHAGRKGRRWLRVRERVLAEHGGICWICGHPGAGSVDHVVPRVQLLASGGDPEDPRNLRPAHGALSRCATCGRCCNEAKGAREHVPHVTGSRAW